MDPSISLLVYKEGRAREMSLLRVISISAGLARETSNRPSIYVFSANTSGVLLSIFGFSSLGRVYKINSIFGLKEYSYKL